eukprot:1713709-Amphidinium_carterae.1
MPLTIRARSGPLQRKAGPHLVTTERNTAFRSHQPQQWEMGCMSIPLSDICPQDKPLETRKLCQFSSKFMMPPTP